jgi:antitoxin ChpS
VVAAAKVGDRLKKTQLLRASAAKIGIAVERGRLVVKPQERRRHTLDELLAQCDPQAPRSKEGHEWLDSKPVGAELI